MEIQQQILCCTKVFVSVYLVLISFVFVFLFVYLLCIYKEEALLSLIADGDIIAVARLPISSTRPHYKPGAIQQR